MRAAVTHSVARTAQECAVRSLFQPLTVPRAPRFYRNLSKRLPYISASAGTGRICSARKWTSQEGERKEMIETVFNDLVIESF